MNKFLKISMIVILFSSVAFYAGWKIGGKFQRNPSYLYYSASQLPLIVTELKLIRKNKIDILLNMKDVDLDGALFSYKLYLDDLRKNHSKPLPIENVGLQIIKEGLLEAYKYRKKYPRTNYVGIYGNKETKELQIEVDEFLEKANKQLCITSTSFRSLSLTWTLRRAAARAIYANVMYATKVVQKTSYEATCLQRDLVFSQTNRCAKNRYNKTLSKTKATVAFTIKL